MDVGRLGGGDDSQKGHHFPEAMTYKGRQFFKEKIG